ncbi:unnamed protein product [Rotaria sp. Silwood2]|nr:unnamed protein product [Rotaria sp. Silwood2]CAF2914383.1 unnamed protein product [Rotaria sp. Silwood2]CAF3993889.1 unnamed protein product [Rotaria sp. Silwood2]CAF4528166.1 unnamed protein product [Rotaria sp. Silwood2]
MEEENVKNKEDYQDDYRHPYRHARKRRNDHGDGEGSTQSSCTPKRRNTEQIDRGSRYSNDVQGETTTSSYFNNHQIFRKQTNNLSSQKHIHESSNSKQQQRESFPPFRIKLKDDKYPLQDVTIIKELNKNCKLNLTYGRMSTLNNEKHYLLYCNTPTQFEALLNKSKWPEKICNCEYSIDFPRRFPSSYSLVVLDIPTQWNVQNFCDELKVRYKTIIKGERLFVKGGRVIPRIRIDFSSNKELGEILKSKRILLDDDNTAYTIEPYVPPTRILRCYICQQYDDHVAAHCPNKDKPICFKCGQQHNYNPKCQNETCCAHCKGNHMAGNPNCPLKIETRENKKMKIKIAPSMTSTHANIWTGNTARHLFGQGGTTESVSIDKAIDSNSNNLMKKFNSIEENIQTILKQQTDLGKQFNDINMKINNQAIEMLNINYILNDIVCPLLKDVTNIIYTQINAQQKHQINSAYNKLVSFLDQKGLNCTSIHTHTQNNRKTFQQQQQITSSLHTIVTSNDTSTEMNHESTC